MGNANYSLTLEDNFLTHFFFYAARYPQREACIFQPRGPETAITLSYEALNHKVIEKAKFLVEQGLTNKPVGLLFPTGIEFVVDFLACLAAGVHAVPMNVTKNSKQLERTLAILSDTGVNTVLTTSDTKILVGSLLEDLGEFRWIDACGSVSVTTTLPTIGLDDIAFIQYTSGSTSAPKGVIVSHRNVVDNQRAIQTACGHKQGLIAGGWLPQFHDMGLIGHMLQPLFLGGTYVFMPPLNFIQRPIRWLQLIDRYRIHSSAAPNFGYEHCTKLIKPSASLEQLDLSCWQVALNGSEPIKAATMKDFATQFAAQGFSEKAFFPCYGMAETTLFVSGGPKHGGMQSLQLDRNALAKGKVSTSQPSSTNADSLNVVNCGELSEHFQCAIVDPDKLTRCADNIVGEIWLRSASVSQGYLKQPQTNSLIFEAAIKGEGDQYFLRTGDLGFVRDGCLFVTGRLKELIILRGKNIYPYDLEHICNGYSHAAGGNGASVFTVSDNNTVKLAAAVEIKKRALKEQCHDAMRRDLTQRLAEGAGITLDYLLLLPPGSLPKTTSGKIRRGECQHLLNTAPLQGEFSH
ncbi:fatty acyl-AMP ligase [Photobacterium angustum]|uniref:AMP-dependent synthetase/ligase domain-containing protein n=1 Tax=Photobacterium angustum TaxID=661 RepID=A0A2S7V8E8_PHOAN|nr:fatty acyl-AMP ligase [Photobacterium angustum]PQJ58486.1 hypothetical protein BTO08_22260 [Photobacterium angustum]